MSSPILRVLFICSLFLSKNVFCADISCKQIFGNTLNESLYAASVGDYDIRIFNGIVNDKKRRVVLVDSG